MEYDVLFSTIAALGAANVYQYRRAAAQYVLAIKKLNDCEEKHELANKELLRLTLQVGRLSGMRESWVHAEERTKDRLDHERD